MTTPPSSPQAHSHQPMPALPGQRALYSALAAGSLAAFISFVAFMLTGHQIGEATTWMVALGLLAFSGVFAVLYFIDLVRTRKH